MKSLLEGVEVPDAAEAEERAWRVVVAAFEPGVTGDGSRVTGFAARPRWAARRRRRARCASRRCCSRLPVVLSLSGSRSGSCPSRRLRLLGFMRSLLLRGCRVAGGCLVSSSSAAWVVRDDGSRRRLGAYQGATWSPHGLFVGVVRGNQLSALTPGGSVRWVVERPGRCRRRAGRRVGSASRIARALRCAWSRATGRATGCSRARRRGRRRPGGRGRPPTCSRTSTRAIASPSSTSTGVGCCGATRRAARRAPLPGRLTGAGCSSCARAAGACSTAVAGS